MFTATQNQTFWRERRFNSAKFRQRLKDQLRSCWSEFGALEKLYFQLSRGKISLHWTWRSRFSMKMGLEIIKIFIVFHVDLSNRQDVLLGKLPYFIGNKAYKSCGLFCSYNRWKISWWDLWCKNSGSVGLRSLREFYFSAIEYRKFLIRVDEDFTLAISEGNPCRISTSLAFI